MFDCIHNRTGLLSIFDLTVTNTTSSVSFTVNTLPIASTVIPSACEYDSMVFSSSLDCLVLFNRFFRVSETSESTRKGLLLVYTSQLQLRAMIPQEQILDVVISIYGILVICSHKVIKYDFCGHFVKAVETKHDM